MPDKSPAKPRYRAATQTVRGGLNHDEQFGSVVPPAYLSTTYRFHEFGRPRLHDYARRSNPGRDMAQAALAGLEGGAGAVLTASGLSALHLLATALLRPGETLLAPHDCYGGSYRLFEHLRQRGAFDVRFVDYHDTNALLQALAQHPKLVLIETPGNPLLRITDIAAVSRLAHEAGARVVADNTFLTPLWQQPLALGADFVVHSCTKYLNGHSDVVAGAVIAKDAADAEELAWWANCIGVTAGAFDSYLLMRGLRTLAPRMAQHAHNAERIVAFLRDHPKVEALYHPSLPGHPGHALARTQQVSSGAMVSFEFDGDVARFVNALRLFTLAESLGGVESLIAHPATMTHAGMSETARQAAGIRDTLLRLSVGIEDADDLIDDLRQAFAVA